MSSTTKKKSSPRKKTQEVKSSPTKEKAPKQESKKKKEENKVFYLDLFGKDLLKKSLPIFLILFLMFFAFFIRSGPVELSGIDERIEANFDANLRNFITRDVTEEFGTLNPAYQQELVEKRFREAKESGYYTVNGQRVSLDDSLQQSIESSKAGFKADSGQTYLLAIDPYHFLRLSYNYYENGHTGTTLVEREGEEVPLTEYKLAPNGVVGTSEPEFHIWLEAFIFKLAGVQEYDVAKLTSLVFLLPVFIAMLAAIPCFFLLREITNDWYASAGTLIMLSIGTFVSRTQAGFVDTDAYNVLFPLCISAFLVFSVRMWEKKVLSSLLSFAAALFTTWFLWAWGSGWYIFVFASLALIAYVLYLLALYLWSKMKDKEILKELGAYARISGIYLFFSYLLTELFLGINIFLKSIGAGLGSLETIAGISSTNIWPNVLSSVAELNTASFAGIVSAAGGPIIFLIALMGLLFLTLNFKPEKKEFNYIRYALLGLGLLWFLLIVIGEFLISFTSNSPLLFLVLLFLPIGLGLLLSLLQKRRGSEIFLALFLSCWVAGTIYMTFNGVRFILLLGPAFAISFALGLYFIGLFLERILRKELSLSKEVSRITSLVLLGVVFLILFTPLLTNAQNTTKGTFPNFDDSWYDSMENLRLVSEEDAIITSWWDFGHFFATVGQRGVTFDGASQETPQAHWVGKLLMEGNETVSRDILLMLSCGGNNAFEYLYETSGDPTRGVWTNQLLYETFGKTKEEKRETLANYEHYAFSAQEIEDAMLELACEEPPENYLITSEDMIGKAGVWAHWGSWNFTKKYVLDNYRNKDALTITQELDANESEITALVEELKEIDLRSRSENTRRKDLVNQWLAPYPSYLSFQNTRILPCEEVNRTFSCLGGQVNFDRFNGNLDVKGFGTSIRKYTFPISQPEPHLAEQEIDPNGDVDLVFLPQNGGMSVMIVQAPLGNSLFTRLFFYGGIGIEHFELISNEEGLAGNRIMIWKTNFEN